MPSVLPSPLAQTQKHTVSLGSRAEAAQLPARSGLCSKCSHSLSFTDRVVTHRHDEGQACSEGESEPRAGVPEK